MQVSVVAEFSLLVSIYKQFPDLAIKNTADRSSHADTKGKGTYAKHQSFKQSCTLTTLVETFNKDEL